ncbi:PAS domain-containing protein [Tenacibaculum maritimum]|nr:PAS domain-containing protein [Tenacibaculum maritimum]
MYFKEASFFEKCLNYSIFPLILLIDMKNDLKNMLCLDLYVASLSQEAYTNLQPALATPTKKHLHIRSWGVQNLFKENTLAKDIKALHTFALAFQWQNDLRRILHKNPSYETLILTNASKEIVWVNDGFQKMTGYDKSFALHKTAGFLQGEKTSLATRKRIRKKLLKNKPFKEVILNYRKDQTSYECELTIFPLASKAKTTHFLALEKEVV